MPIGTPEKNKALEMGCKKLYRHREKAVSVSRNEKGHPIGGLRC